MFDDVVWCASDVVRGPALLLLDQNVTKLEAVEGLPAAVYWWVASLEGSPTLPGKACLAVALNRTVGCTRFRGLMLLSRLSPSRVAQCRRTAKQTEWLWRHTAGVPGS